jgi:NADH-quinone oxidoreductase subunit J
VETLENADLIKILAVIVLGATGTYLLLPHKHGLTRPKLAHQIGFGLATLAVFAFTLLWKAHGVDFISKVFFYLFAFSAVGGGILTIISRDPIHNALWFASVILSTSGLFLLSGAQFLAAGTVIVYAGAIIVTFLFVLMLAQKEGRAVYDRMARSPFWATFASFLLLFGLIYSLVALRGTSATVESRNQPGVTSEVKLTGNSLIPMTERLAQPRRITPDQGMVLDRALPATSMLPEAVADGQSFNRHVAGLGGTLYTEHLVTVELAGALLFVALIGALAIATPRAPIRPSTSDAAPKA